MISILIITYNQEKYLSKTLESILSQEFPETYEIVIGEDFSTDGTKKIVEEFHKKYPDIIKPIYNTQNKGLIQNYYNTYSHCRGELIMECAGDDWWLADKVKIQTEYMKQHPDIGMCYGVAKKWDECNQKFSKDKFGSGKSDFSKLILGNDIPAPTVCFRKALMDRYIEEIQPIKKNWLMEDYPQWLWFSINSRISFIDKYLSVYRVQNNSGSHFNSLERFLSFRKSTWDIQNFFSEKYLKTSILPFDANLHSFYFHVLNRDRKNAFRSIREVTIKTNKIRVIKLLSSNSLSFKFLVLYYLRKFS